jgi:hypothetical protein
MYAGRDVFEEIDGALEVSGCWALFEQIEVGRETYAGSVSLQEIEEVRDI